MRIYTYVPTTEGIFTCIYEAWASGLGHRNVKLVPEPVEQYSFFDEYVHVEPDEEKVEKVIRALQVKLNYHFYTEMCYASLSYEEDAGDTMYRVMILGFAYGPSVMESYRYAPVVRLLEIRKKVTREVHMFREFMRFHSLENGLLVAHFEPRSSVLVPVSWHFEERMPSETFIIVDDTHRMAFLHPKDGESILRYLTDEEYARLQEAEQAEDAFTRQWKIFFDAIAIKQRRNEKCQTNLFPKWMRKHVTEFM